MAKGLRAVMTGLFVLVVASSFLVSGCNRYANEEQLNALDETTQAADAAEAKVAELEKEKTDLQAELDQKQKDLEYAESEKAKVQEKM